ncbi:uncharacterized protein LOC124542785 [Vanessa cardui]|uniref:uncharacterized protein LOC124542785 n=1 Tax=Vanessa cardui TaxID=171605 RepID=UPI001F132C93|nr:uncharacterized protein LOC124542785 [Vanessa cardui]
MAVANETSTGSVQDAQTLEKFKTSFISSIGDIFKAQITKLEDWLPPAKMQRPPLAADKRRELLQQHTYSSYAQVAHPAPQPKSAPTPKQASPAAPTAPIAGPSSAPIAPATMAQETRKRILRSPRLLVTYAQILERAEQCVKLRCAVGDVDSTVAVLTRSGTGPPLSLVDRGSGYVVVGWKEYVIVGTYFSPNRSLAEFESHLGFLRAAVASRSPRQVVVLGDFNAKSRAWGNPATNPGGRAAQVWTLLSSLSLLNRRQVHTCVRQQGGSVVDLSFATPVAARRVLNWRVKEEVGPLSDHRYIRFEISTSDRWGQTGELPRVPTTLPRWSVGQLDRELVKEAAIVQRWGPTGRREGASIDELVGRMQMALKKICDAAMPRSRLMAPRRQDACVVGRLWLASGSLSPVRPARCVRGRARARAPPFDDGDVRSPNILPGLKDSRERKWADVVEAPNDSPPLRLQFSHSRSSVTAREDLHHSS